MKYRSIDLLIYQSWAATDAFEAVFQSKVIVVFSSRWPSRPSGVVLLLSGTHYLMHESNTDLPNNLSILLMHLLIYQSWTAIATFQSKLIFVL